MAHERNIYAYWAGRLDLTRRGLPALLGSLSGGPFFMARYMPERAIIGQELHGVYQHAAAADWSPRDSEQAAAEYTADYAARVIALRARWSTHGAALDALTGQFPGANDAALRRLSTMVADDLTGYRWVCSPLALELRLGY